MKDEILLGCCGAYCKTCKAFTENFCKGCKIGYGDKSRDLSKAKCKMKICCLKKGFISCADCKDLEICSTMRSFFSKNGYKYGKYKQAIYYIREYGYKKFFTIANSWKMQYGKYPKVT
jgi:hypothetical protein